MDMGVFHKGQMSDSLLTAMFIVLSGGFQDAYTYVCRGKVFANAQTGNIVLMSTHLFDRHYADSFRYMIPIAAFFTLQNLCFWVILHRKIIILFIFDEL